MSRGTNENATVSLTGKHAIKVLSKLNFTKVSRRKDTMICIILMEKELDYKNRITGKEFFLHETFYCQH